MHRLLLICILPGCSILFIPAEEEIASVDSGTEEVVVPDSGWRVSFVDGGFPDAGIPDAMIMDVDASVDAAPMPDSSLPQPDAAICDPFDVTPASFTCYVGNDPLAGPDLYIMGTNGKCGTCTQSNDCQPGNFCTGYTGSPGVCQPLCDQDHPCSEGSCVSVLYQGYGYCQTSCE